MLSRSALRPLASLAALAMAIALAPSDAGAVLPTISTDPFTQAT
jgi:hypothetical protein